MQVTNNPQTIFFEVQRFVQQRWLVLAIVAADLFAIIVVAGVWLATKEVLPTAYQYVLLCLLAVILSVPMAILVITHMTTMVTNERLIVTMFPLQVFSGEIEIPRSDIVSVRVVQYEPLREYCGWGIRRSRSDGHRAFTVAGVSGVMIQIRGGDKFLIGSQRPDELARAIQQRN